MGFMMELSELGMKPVDGQWIIGRHQAHRLRQAIGQAEQPCESTPRIYHQFGRWGRTTAVTAYHLKPEYKSDSRYFSLSLILHHPVKQSFTVLVTPRPDGNYELQLSSPDGVVPARQVPRFLCQMVRPGVSRLDLLRHALHSTLQSASPSVSKTLQSA